LLVLAAAVLDMRVEVVLEVLKQQPLLQLQRVQVTP
jgi:hypothetical protein